MDIISVGEMVVDFLPGLEPGSYVRNAGGAPANVAIAVSRNGLESSLCCSVGDDDFGRFLINTLKENQVKVLNPKLYPNAVTTMAFVSLDEHGERSFTFARKPGADMFLEPSDIREEDIKAGAIVHAGSCSLSAEPVAEATRKALKLGHEYGKMVSFDVNYRNLMWNDDQEACKKAVFEVLPYIDLLKISSEEVDMIGGEDHVAKVMADHQITLTVETLGSHGARCFYKDEVFEVPGINKKAVDTTGAGDAFWGGFLSSLRMQGVENVGQLSAERIRKAMNYGNAAGWICCQSKGAIASLPTRDKIENLLGGGK